MNPIRLNLSRLAVTSTCRFFPGHINSKIYQSAHRYCKASLSYDSLKANWESTLRRAKVLEKVQTEIPRHDAIVLLLSLVCAEQWNALRTIFSHYDTFQNQAQSSDELNIPEGSSVSHEIEKQKMGQFYSSALDVNIIGAVIIQYLQLTQSIKNTGKTPLDCVCELFGMLPHSFLLDPLLLSIILTPSWNVHRLRNMEDVDSTIDNLCSNRTEFLDESLINSPTGAALIHYLYFRSNFPESQLTFTEFRKEYQASCHGIFKFKYTHLLRELASIVLDSPVDIIGNDEIAPRLQKAYQLSVVHFLSIYPAKHWKSIQKVIPDICRDNLKNYSRYCYLALARLAALSGDAGDCIDICNTHLATAYPSDSHLICTLGIVAAHLEFRRTDTSLIVSKQTEDSNEHKFTIMSGVDDLKKAFTVSSCLNHFHERSRRPPAHWLSSIFSMGKTHPTIEKRCLQIIQESTHPFYEEDICSICDILSRRKCASGLKKVTTGLRYFTNIRGKSSDDSFEKTNLVHGFELFKEYVPSLALDVELSIGTATVLMSRCLKASGCSDFAFDIFWMSVFPSLVAKPSGTEIVSDPTLFAIGLAVCTQKELRKPVEIILRYIIENIKFGGKPLPVTSSEAEFLDERYVSTSANPVSNTRYSVYRSQRKQTLVGFLQAVFTTTNSYLSETERVKLGHFLETIDERETFHAKMGGEEISLGKVYDLSIGKFPRSLLV